ncbi:hypothetical protein L3Q82_006829 [Scortum barcoo]|uniref:Uncharacterized protein n=1 Tax=Scortum barcoo TaxID=214431 RepID=A0ACB8WVU2_9TELE|nr:hypothetical protein L3Q82_006829 [Scortum barcoo]
MFTSAPVLTMPDPQLQFIVEVDASNEGIGVTLFLTEVHSLSPPSGSSFVSSSVPPSASPLVTTRNQRNDQTEWLNQELETCLRCLVVQNQTTWSDHLTWIEYAHNSLPTAATGLSPFQVVHGYQPPLFPVNEEEVTVPSAHVMAKRKSSKEDPLVNFSLKELADSFAGRKKTGSSETEKEEKKVEVVLVPVEQVVSDLKEQLKSDLKALQDKRDKFKQVEETYNEVTEHLKTQLLSTERQIRAEFNKLHQFLREEEESRLAALREEEEQKGKKISREMKMIQEHISSLSDSICAVEEDLQKHNVPFLSSYKPTQTRARVQGSLSDPQLLLSGAADRCGQTPGQPVLQSLGEDEGQGPLQSCHSGPKHCKPLALSVR